MPNVKTQSSNKGVIHALGLANPPTPQALWTVYRTEQEQVLTRIGQTPLSELPALAAWRAAFRTFGVDPTQYRSAAEALLRRLRKKGDIPSINTLVDLANLVSIRYALPVAIFDLASVTGTVTVQFATGNEIFKPLGPEGAGNPSPGEVIFADEAGHVLARRWCWRQSAASAAGEQTQQALITTEAHTHQVGLSSLGRLHDLFVTTEAVTPGEFKSGGSGLNIRYGIHHSLLGNA